MFCIQTKFSHVARKIVLKSLTDLVKLEQIAVSANTDKTIADLGNNKQFSHVQMFQLNSQTYNLTFIASKLFSFALLFSRKRKIIKIRKNNFSKNQYFIKFLPFM